MLSNFRDTTVVRLRVIFERYLWRVVSTLGVFIFFILAIRFLLVDVGQVDGQSMEPTFIDNQIFIVDRLRYLFVAPARYDLVQAVVPGTSKVVLKRIVGLPGETVIIKRGKIFIQSPDTNNAQELRESYLASSVYTTIKGQQGPREFRLYPGQYFVVGDNRPYSNDSRAYGSVGRERIVGKVVWWRRRQ